MKAQCRICKLDKPVSEFNLRKDNKTGHRTECKECQSSNLRNHYNNNRISKLEKQRLYQNKNHHIKKYRDYLKNDLKKFNTELNFSKIELKERLKSECFYCGEIDKNRGLDRIDNTKGHTIENTVVCCELCNMTRGDRFSVDEMKLLGYVIKKIKKDRL